MAPLMVATLSRGVTFGRLLWPGVLDMSTLLSDVSLTDLLPGPFLEAALFGAAAKSSFEEHVRSHVIQHVFTLGLGL